MQTKLTLQVPDDGHARYENMSESETPSE